MSQQPAEGPGGAGLTPFQLGGCIGAVAALFAQLGWQELSRPPGDAAGAAPGLMTGVWSGVGAMAGVAVAALVSRARRP